MKRIYYILLVLALQLSSKGFAQRDTLNHYTDAEITKLVKYIKNLEERTAAYLVRHPDASFVNTGGRTAQEQLELNDLIHDSTHRYNDAQIIKLANYIKHLEKLDGLAKAEQDEIAARLKKRHDDSLAAVIAAANQQVNQYQNQINFDFDSSVLKKESYSALDDAVKQLQKLPDMAFAIEGHTDNVGEDAYNLNLSKARAKVVMNYFISKGIPASRLSSEGFGESKPIATNDTEEGKAKNRRVEIKAKKK
jgi:outer membrane protein OmpA-like peptidoglycan-associated protein